VLAVTGSGFYRPPHAVLVYCIGAAIALSKGYGIFIELHFGTAVESGTSSGSCSWSCSSMQRLGVGDGNKEMKAVHWQHWLLTCCHPSSGSSLRVSRKFVAIG